MELSGFRTPVEPTPFPRQLQLGKPLITLGSCFADSIGTRLHASKFDVMVNPAGVIYQPGAVHQLIDRALTNVRYDPADFLEHQGIWYSYDFHSSVNALSSAELKSKMDTLGSQLKTDLLQADTVMITYGTAWVYRRVQTGGLVSNCHKQPGKNFSKELLDVAAVTNSFRQMVGELRAVNPQVQIILTVSPVRHLAETAEANQVSKSVLRMACHQLAAADPLVHYFPAYEIMMDDLRDYRFYARDMIHPTDVALDYIWTKFQASAFSAETIALTSRWEKILQALAHRPFHPESPAHRDFLIRLRQDVSGFAPHFDVQEQLKLLDAQITP